MKDIRDLENYEEEIEEKSTSKAGWCACVVLYIWDCLKAMGRGFEFDNKNSCQRPKGK